MSRAAKCKSKSSGISVNSGLKRGFGSLAKLARASHGKAYETVPGKGLSKSGHVKEPGSKEVEEGC